MMGLQIAEATSKSGIAAQVEMARRAMEAALEAAAAAEKGANAAHEVAVAAVRTTKATAAARGGVTPQEEQATMTKVMMAVSVRGVRTREKGCFSHSTRVYDSTCAYLRHATPPPAATGDGCGCGSR